MPRSTPWLVAALREPAPSTRTRSIRWIWWKKLGLPGFQDAPSASPLLPGGGAPQSAARSGHLPRGEDIRGRPDE